VNKQGAKISRRTLLRRTALAGGALCVPSFLAGCKTSRVEPEKIFRAGAYVADITPKKFPISVNGMMQDRTATRAFDPLRARCLVLDDGRTRIAIAICDSLLISRELVDEAKALAQRATGIPAGNMLIAATHTHSAPTVTPIFQSEPDADYSQFLVERIAAGIARAYRNLAPARVGWAVTPDATQTFCRLWIVRKPAANPFGQQSDRIVMHPGYQNPNSIEPAGPTDPMLTLLSVQSPEGQPIALLANYTMHYAQDEPYLSADYFGYFADKFTKLIGAENVQPAFVAMMSNGAQGDAHCFDYSKPQQARTRDSVAESLARAALDAYGKVEYHNSVPLAVRERTLTLGVRLPGEAEATAAREILENAKGRLLKGLPEIYARETDLLSKYPKEVPLKMQALRIGEFGIVALPVEAYTITGLQIKRASPLRPACIIDLANGYNGYLAPPEHHLLGGYSTWRARSSYLAPDTAPKVVTAALELLREISGKNPPRAVVRPASAFAHAVLASQPLAYWPLNELTGPRAHDVTEHGNHALYEPKVLFFLAGPRRAVFPGFGAGARAPYFFDQRLTAQFAVLGKKYSVAFWFCNRRHFDDQILTSYIFSRAAADGVGDHLGIGGTSATPQRLFFVNGKSRQELLAGKTDLVEGRWYHLVLVRDGESARVFLNGRIELTASAIVAVSDDATQIFLAGRSDNLANFEGKICHVSVYARALGADEVAGHFATAKRAA
jgi:hypothetical protein